MLENNPIYKIYKSGKIPVIRYSDYGFKNFIQDKFFTDDNGNIVEKCKGIEGCFCVLGGMQDSFILSGLKNVSVLNIGWIEPDTKVFDVNTSTYKTAKSILDKAMEVYSKIEEERKDDPKTYMDKNFDDFDIFYTQVIVNADYVNDVESYTEKEQEQFAHTIFDGFFGIQAGMDYFFKFQKCGDMDKFMKFLDDNNIFHEFIKQSFVEFTDDILMSSIAAFQCNDLIEESGGSLETFIRELAPDKSTDEFKNASKIKSFIKNHPDFDGNLYGDKYSTLGHGRTKNGYKLDLYVKDKKLEIVIKHDSDYKKQIIPHNKLLLNNVELIELARSKISALKDVVDMTNQLGIDKTEPELKRIDNLINFYDKYKDEIFFTNEMFRYNKNEFTIEYYFDFDDVIINYSRQSEIDLDNPDKLYHEEDIYLKFSENIGILDIVKDYRNNVLLHSLEKENIIEIR